MRWVLGPTTLTGGGGAHAHPGLRFGVPHSPLFEVVDRGGDVIRRRDRCGRPLTSPSLLPLRFSLDLLSRLRVGPPGWELPRPIPPLARDRQWLSRSGTPSIDRCLFALIELALHRGAGSFVPRAGFSPIPHARRFLRRGPGYDYRGGRTHNIGPVSRDACFTLSSASACDFSRVRRVRRLGLGPRSLPAHLAMGPAL